MSQIRSYYQGEGVVCGITVRNKLGEQTNPDNGVDFTLIDSGGNIIVDAQACTQGQYDEDNDNTTGQYFYPHELASDAELLLWQARFNVDPGGTVEGNKVFEQFFKVIELTATI